MCENPELIKKSKIIHYFGIGAFLILTLFELSGFFGEIMKDTLIVSKQNPKMTYILSVLTSLVTFTIMLILLVKKIKSYSDKNSRKILLISIFSLIFSWIITACYDQFITGNLKLKYIDNFNDYSEFWKEEYLLMGILAGVPILYYIILGIVVLNKKL